MKARTIAVLHIAALAFVIGLGVLAIAYVLSGCTVIYIEGDGDTVRDVGGGHGAGLSVDGDAPPLSGERLHRLTPDR
jgi:hypothetical protein